jgi:hypothetical protein
MDQVAQAREESLAVIVGADSVELLAELPAGGIDDAVPTLRQQ